MEPNQKKANGLALIPFAVFVGFTWPQELP